MKTRIITLLIAITAIIGSAEAQTKINIHQGDEIVYSVPLADIDSVGFQKQAEANQHNGHEFVDLGLPSGLKWATCNVGASKPEEYGDYFAWGETQPKYTYNWDTYMWYNGIEVTKYDNYSGGDGKTTLEPLDDAAYVNWGDGWRMPTEAEQQELVDNCTWISETRNGINGYKVISNKPGYKEKSIFIPIAGYMKDDAQMDCHECHLWSSTLYCCNPQYAVLIVYSSLSSGLYGHDRFLGKSVRPVRQ